MKMNRSKARETISMMMRRKRMKTLPRIGTMGILIGKCSLL